MTKVDKVGRMRRKQNEKQTAGIGPDLSPRTLARHDCLAKARTAWKVLIYNSQELRERVSEYRGKGVDLSILRLRRRR